MWIFCLLLNHIVSISCLITRSYPFNKLSFKYLFVNPTFSFQFAFIISIFWKASFTRQISFENSWTTDWLKRNEKSHPQIYKYHNLLSGLYFYSFVRILRLSSYWWKIKSVFCGVKWIEITVVDGKPILLATVDTRLFPCFKDVMFIVSVVCCICCTKNKMNKDFTLLFISIDRKTIFMHINTYARTQTYP